MGKKLSKAEQIRRKHQARKLYFLGMTQQETAEHAGISMRTADRYWKQFSAEFNEWIRNQPGIIEETIARDREAVKDAWKNWEKTRDRKWLLAYNTLSKDFTDKLLKLGYLTETPKKVELSERNLFREAMREYGIAEDEDDM